MKGSVAQENLESAEVRSVSEKPCHRIRENLPDPPPRFSQQQQQGKVRVLLKRMSPL